MGWGFDMDEEIECRTINVGNNGGHDVYDNDVEPNIRVGEDGREWVGMTEVDRVFRKAKLRREKIATGGGVMGSLGRAFGGVSGKGGTRKGIARKWRRETAEC